MRRFYAQISNTYVGSRSWNDRTLGTVRLIVSTAYTYVAINIAIEEGGTRKAQTSIAQTSTEVLEVS